MTYLSSKIFLDHIMRAELLTINKAMEKALFQSSGKYKAHKLAKMGHPYSERKGGANVPYSDPARINVQSGDFSLAWQREKPVFTGSTIRSRITNPSRYANRLALGIKGKTIPRPLIPKIMPVVEYWRIRNLMIGIRDAIQASR